MTDLLIGIYGASGFGKEVLPLVRSEVERLPTLSKICFIDDNSELSQLAGIRVVTYTEFKGIPSQDKKCVIAIANSLVREKISEDLSKDKITELNVNFQNNILMDNIELGKGSILCPFVTLTSNIIIGKSFHANIYSYVAHDCIIGDYVTFAPRVMCNGNVKIEDHAYIGTGAILKQGRPDKPLIIGKGAVVGMGAVVTKDVPANTVVVGNPAKPLNNS